jgi:hypothetical protein
LRLVAGGWFVLREKYYWLVADKPSEQAVGVAAVGLLVPTCEAAAELLLPAHEAATELRAPSSFGVGGRLGRVGAWPDPAA